MTYRVIALDVDGTLLNDDHEVTPRVREAVRAAARRGAEIVLCTGRGSTSALPVLDELGLQGTMITHNGASIVDSASRTVLFETAISPEAAEPYLAYLRDRQLHFDMNTSFDLFVNRLGDEAARMYAAMHARPILREISEGLPEHTVKLSVYAPKVALDGVEREWRELDRELLQYIRSGDEFIDVQHPHASKGKSLEKLAAIRGIPRGQVLAIGNYYNDIGMLAFAGHGVAMDNSPAEVKAEADSVTLSNNEDGVAAALERLGIF
ncbi:Cof-type HAD-IIB family hydrolase [Cohnella sp. CFH 77786]|uniref:Cof-type HAD-IIB family hydrolase n=1 Tax=Cohnella sp. CFH 77786 TaxID=2662265 RepID=UPI001C60B802|nr:Cof-type HAD-IIB family hydrolase [Cohnella sp. CFH 77786]MBW5445114.1 Cof-type HAD-IIB family hydrolase [Cohnella sp. CFH 77786]